MGVPLTLNIQTGRKLADKSKNEILTKLGNVFGAEGIRAVQVCYDTVRVTFIRTDVYLKAKENTGLYLFGLWCNILGGGPPVTVVNLFDYPYEEDDQIVEDTMDTFGVVKRIKLMYQIPKFLRVPILFLLSFDLAVLCPGLSQLMVLFAEFGIVASL